MTQHLRPESKGSGRRLREWAQRGSRGGETLSMGAQRTVWRCNARAELCGTRFRATQLEKRCTSECNIAAHPMASTMDTSPTFDYIGIRSRGASAHLGPARPCCRLVSWDRKKARFTSHCDPGPRELRQSIFGAPVSFKGVLDSRSGGARAPAARYKSDSKKYSHPVPACSASTGPRTVRATRRGARSAPSAAGVSSVSRAQPHAQLAAATCAQRQPVLPTLSA